MTALGHYSRQAEGSIKLMGQPLVHPQRLGSLVEVFSYFLVRDEQGLIAPLSSLLLGTFLGWNFAPFQYF